jgi:hypothetical protein
MTRPYVHTLYFTDRFRLSEAFERIIDDERVESCVVETDELRIRFVTTPERASALIERIYLDRGLRFSQRNSLGG